MNYILFDSNRLNLLPFTHTRPVADIRCGILTMRERWQNLLLDRTSTLTEAYLQEVFPLITSGKNVLVNASVFGDEKLTIAIRQLKPGNKLVSGNTLIAAHIDFQNLSIDKLDEITGKLNVVEYDESVNVLSHTWDIFSMNDMAIRADFELLTTGRESQPIPEGVTIIGSQYFIEEDAIINPGCIINTNGGPVYIDKYSEILEGALIRGPLAMREHSVLKMGAKVYGATTLGPGCKVGGEINNVVFFANSNKAHDGYLGNAVIGEWCNLGADTNCSNLKNNYDLIKVWDEHQNQYIATGLTFCGLMMGDHSKCGINTMFNTGTVVGVSCNIYGGGFPGKFIPSYAWGGSEGVATYEFDKAMTAANRMMQRRGRQLSEAETRMYRYIFTNTSNQRQSFNQE